MTLDNRRSRKQSGLPLSVLPAPTPAGYVVPEGALIEVTLTIRMPCAAAPDHIDEWLADHLGGFGGVAADNPLTNNEPESWGLEMPTWSDSGRRGRSEDSPRVKYPDGTVRWTTRRWSEPRHDHR